MDSGCISVCWGAFSCYTVSSRKTGHLELVCPAQEARPRQAPGIPEHTRIPLVVQAESFRARGLEVAGLLKVPSLLRLLDWGWGRGGTLKSGSIGAWSM